MTTDFIQMAFRSEWEKKIKAYDKYNDTVKTQMTASTDHKGCKSQPSRNKGRKTIVWVTVSLSG